MRFENRNLSTLDRRRFITALAAGGAFFTEKGLFAQALTLTPAQTEGPYYPDRLPLDSDNDLLVINNNITPGLGTVAWLSGRVLDRTGRPVRNATVEIWQADNYGSYIHSQGTQNGRRDSNFQGWGRFVTASDGAYLFRTIKPGLYTGRVRHVHAKVTIPGGTSLTTQLYIEGETSGNDGVLSGISNAAQRASVIRPWAAIPGSPIGALAVDWDIVMGYTVPETPAVTRPTLVSMTGAASGSWLEIHGNGLASATRTWRSNEIVNGKLPESLDGVSVRINNQPASVYYISPTQINVLAPDTTIDANAPVAVTNSAGTSTEVTVAFKRLKPSFFQFPNENAAAVRSDGTLIGPSGLFDGAVTVPAKPGDVVLLYGTGFGPTTPGVTAGQVPAAPAATTNPVKIQIDTKEVAVAFAGLTGAGLYQFNVTIPDLADGDYPVTAEVGGVRTEKFAKLRIQRAAAAERNPVKADKTQYALLLQRITA